MNEQVPASEPTEVKASRLRWIIHLFWVLPLLSVIGLAAWVTHYPSYVESRFDRLLRSLRRKSDAKVSRSSCLGDPAESIRLYPIVYSKWTNKWPYMQKEKSQRARDYMQSTYWHGYWFNYCKQLQIDGDMYLAYWSLKEGQWHVGNLTYPGNDTREWKAFEWSPESDGDKQ
jgi:hypothetical protein